MLGHDDAAQAGRTHDERADRFGTVVAAVDALLATGTPLALRLGTNGLLGADPAKPVANSLRANARVAITRCAAYGPAVRPAMAKCFDLLGGIGALVKDKTVTVKLNLTSTDFTEWLGRPVGETFMTHFDTVRALADELPATVPLLGFAGAPFTVASYLIEGRPSRTYEHTKRLMHTDPALWHALMERLVQHAVASVASQLANGARAFQLFDSWAGTLSRADYDRFVLPHSSAVFAQLRALHPGAPGIHYGVGCDHLLESMYAAGPTVMGLDWRTSIAAARARMGEQLVVQGNLDPVLALAGTDVALAGTDAVLADNAGHLGHIFNLGHGVHPPTDPDVLAAVVARVHERTSR